MDYLLFVDDDPAFLKINRIFFEKLGYTVFTASDRSEMEKCLKKQPLDCIVLDILIPGEGNNGYLLCEEIKRSLPVPVIFLSSLTEREFIYRGFELGAGDYLTKPYDLKELELRIRARINERRGNVRLHEVLSFPPLVIDASTRKVSAGGVLLGMTSHEFDILLLLARHSGTIYSMEAIYREIWRLPDLNSAQTVRVHLAHMRHKLESACPEYRFIHVVWGKGFLFEPQKKETI